MRLDLEPVLSRLKSIDFMKGFGLMFVLFAHWSLWWTDHSWTSASAFVLLFTRFFGIPNFVLMSIIGTILSLKGKASTASKRQQFTRMARRAFIFISIGAVNNLIYGGKELLGAMVPIVWKILFVLFSCNVITFIGIAQVLLFFFKRIHVGFQIAITFAIIVMYYAYLPVILPFVNPGTPNTPELLASSPATVVYTFFFMEATMAPLIPSLAWPFLANIVFTRLASAISTASMTRGRIVYELKIVQIISASLMVAGILFGSVLTKGIFSYFRYYELLSQDWATSWFAGGYPLFLHLTNPSYVLFSFGALSLILTIVLQRVDLDAARGQGWNVFSTFGRYSLTVYLLNPIAFFFPIPINLVGFMILFSAASGLTIAGTLFWEKRWKGKCSVEWFIRTFTNTNITFSFGVLASIFSPRRQKDGLYIG